MIERRGIVRLVMHRVSESGGVALANLSGARLKSREPVNIGTPAQIREIASGQAPKMNSVELLLKLGQQAPELQHLLEAPLTEDHLIDLVDSFEALEIRRNPGQPDLKLINGDE
jgi:hypothetical protein